MTFHLTTCSRRRFLAATTAGSVALLTADPLWAAEVVAPVHWALLADTHIATDPEETNSGTNMLNNLNRVIDQILAEPNRPAGAIINGDCAYLKGLAGDYQTLRKSISRLVDAGIPVHMTMGNHDDRQPFYAALQDQKPETQLVEGKHVAVIQAGPVNLFLVDSLLKVNVVTGEIGSEQLSWLDRALKQHADKPAIVFGHHHPNVGGSVVNGLKDTDAFLELLHSHPQVQAYFFGHTHNWNLSQSNAELHLINQPPVAYLFNKSRPNGWVRMTVSDETIDLELRALDESHEQYGEQHQLPIRSLAATR